MYLFGNDREMRGCSFNINKIFTYIALALIGFFNALPIPILGSNLSLYLAELGFEKNSIGLFSLLGLPFCFKLFWAPIIDSYTLPFFQQRKGWLALCLFAMGAGVLVMGIFDPKEHLVVFCGAALFLSLFAGCLYMVGLSYELESLEESCYGIGSSFVTSGYRLGLLFGGACTLYVAHIMSWKFAFFGLCILLLSAALYILMLHEPYKSEQVLQEKRARASAYSSSFAYFFSEILVAPCKAFFQKNEYKTILFILLLFKLGDNLSKSMEGPFYLQLGFDKKDLALANKTWGFVATLLGSFVGGFFLYKNDSVKGCVYFGLIHAWSLPLLWLHAFLGKSYMLLYMTSFFANATAGMAITAFIALLWSSCTRQYAAVQYALLWSLFSLKGHLLACCGGFLASMLSWPNFFVVVSVFGVASAFFCLLWPTRHTVIAPSLLK